MAAHLTERQKLENRHGRHETHPANRKTPDANTSRRIRKDSTESVPQKKGSVNMQALQGTDIQTGKPIIIYQERENGREKVELDGQVQYWPTEEFLKRVEIF